MAENLSANTLSLLDRRNIEFAQAKRVAIGNERHGPDHPISFARDEVLILSSVAVEVQSLVIVVVPRPSAFEDRPHGRIADAEAQGRSRAPSSLPP
jgi:hypothetical protein